MRIPYLSPHIPWVWGKHTAWSGPSFPHAPLQASPTRCPLMSCPPVRKRPQPPLPTMSTARTGIWTSRGLAQVSLSRCAGRGLKFCRESGQQGVPQASLKGHLWGSVDARRSFPLSQRGYGGSAHTDPSRSLSAEQSPPTCRRRGVGLSSSSVRAWGEAAVRARGSGRSARHDFQSSPARALAELLCRAFFAQL